MAEEKIRVTPVATRIRRDEAEEIAALPEHFGANMADKLRVLIRYAMEHTDEVSAWLGVVDGQPVT